MVTMELAAEVNYWKERSQLLEEQNYKHLTVVEDYNPHSVRRRERRKMKIKELQQSIKILKKMLQSLKRVTYTAKIKYKCCYNL